MKVIVMDGKMMPADMEAATRKLSEKFRDIIAEYIKNKEDSYDYKLKSMVVTNAMLHSFSSLLCSLFYHEETKVVDLEQEIDKICEGLKKQCMMSYKWKIKKDLEGEGK